ncbi:transposase [Pseudomonas aeruginosa]|uniref:Mu transposase C-terminal domain-containing protein n=1 Tax=Pseudomonas aeruginosa TaxID=287 RepID=UPI001067B8B4|nr:Mu transposase C-terminal domain-containing protein [Pseudomonas aeruginosa]TEF29310.1 transposase [Pseudomonas aeruginosa]TEF37123.1 transposase [Pseudomonas aeruginosa]HEJ2566224.1 DDE-type integrase/transposase/recombinase [Pseudomonas aeruginosa]HEJ2657454.1 DDE-type integrase/transposase/recombinase [Pseudomonas aeruginosa]
MMVMVNDIVEPLAENLYLSSKARVLWIDAEADSVHLMFLEKPMRKPSRLRFSTLTEWLETGQARVALESVAVFMLREETELSPKEVLLRDENWKFIEKLVYASRDGSIFYGDCFSRLINDQVEQFGCHKSQVYRLIFRYWFYGQTKNALLQNRTNAGAPGQRRISREGRALGRPRVHLGLKLPSVAKVLNESDLRCIRIGYSLFANNGKIKIAKAYRKMLSKFYSYRSADVDSEYSDDDPSIEIYPPGMKPTFDQFKHWGEKIFSDMDVLRGRVSERVWQKDMRALRGRAHDNLHGPGHRYEVDATIGDIYLVSEFNRNWVIGRPVIYAVIDTCSRMVVGLHVALEGPSWNSARHALYNAFTNKKVFCAEYGISIEPEEWPCYHLPFEIMVDRGELNSDKAQGIVDGLGIDISVAPPFRPDWKAVVEQYFRIINNNISIDWIPGAVLGRGQARERGERDYREDAVLTLKEFARIIIKAALFHNKTFRNPTLLTNEMIGEGVEPTPIQIWSWSLHKQRIESKNIPAQLIYLNLLPRCVAKIRAGGIEVNGMLYVCNRAIEHKWLERARNKGVSSVTAWYDPNCTWHVWIKDPSGEFSRCTLVPSDNRYRGYRVEEVIDMMAVLRKPSPEQREFKLQEQVKLDEFNETVVKAAVSEKSKRQKPKTKTERTSNISSNRKVEMMVERERTSIPDGLRDSAQQIVPAKGESSNVVGIEVRRVIDLLKREHK